MRTRLVENRCVVLEFTRDFGDRGRASLLVSRMRKLGAGLSSTDEQPSDSAHVLAENTSINLRSVRESKSYCFQSFSVRIMGAKSFRDAERGAMQKRTKAGGFIIAAAMSIRKLFNSFLSSYSRNYQCQRRLISL